MQWSQMNNAQRAFLTQHAQWRPVFDNTGALRRHEPFNAYAKVIVAAKRLDRDADEARKRNATTGNAAIVAAYLAGGGEVRRPKVTRCQAAYGAGELTRKRAGALPMQFYRTGGSIG